MGTQVQGDCGKNCLSYLWPINVAVLDINTANETKLTFTFYTKSHSLKKEKVYKIFINFGILGCTRALILTKMAQ